MFWALREREEVILITAFYFQERLKSKFKEESQIYFVKYCNTNSTKQMYR